jgi:hypothetical protein
MKIRSIRIPEDIEKALAFVARSEKLEETQSLRKLTRLGFEFYAAKSYEKGRLTLRELSELLNLTLSETIELLNEIGVKGNIRARDVLESLMTISPRHGNKGKSS